MTRKKSEDAVSPVIGVMLMLVVTVVIAAVVAVFATGMVEDTEPAPIAKLDVKIISDQPITGGESIANSNAQHPGTVPTLHLTHVSGDSLNTENLKLSFSWECDNPDCTQGHQHTSTYQAGKGDKITPGTSAAFDGKAYVPIGYGDTIEPLYINYGGSSGGFFGNHILKRGETMIAYDKHLMVPDDDVEMAGNPAMDVLFNNGKVITENDATRTEQREVLSGVIPGATYVKNKDIHPVGSTCPQMEGTAADAYYNYEQHLFICSGCSNSGQPVVAPCPFCGVTSPADDVDNWVEVCPACGKNIANVKQPYVIPQDETIIGTGYSAGIMACLTEGTAVKVIITHTPSNKVIYEDRVFVE